MSNKKKKLIFTNFNLEMFILQIAIMLGGGFISQIVILVIALLYYVFHRSNVL